MKKNRIRKESRKLFDCVNYSQTIFLVVLCVLLIVGAAGCSAAAPAADKAEQAAEVDAGSDGGAGDSGETGYQKITAEEAHQMMDETTGFVLLDVRTEEEYREKRIEGAVLMPVTEIESRAEAELPDKGQTIFVYCRSGVRSANAAKTLAGLGYTNVFDIGGINDWPFETISNEGR